MQRYLTWVGGSFDPEVFDPETATKAMVRGLPEWRQDGMRALIRVIEKAPAQMTTITTPVRMGPCRQLAQDDAWKAAREEVVVPDQQVITRFVLPGCATTVALLWIDVDDEEGADETVEPGSNGS